jgi:polar amino acid transport system substrate-binding protein
MTGPADRDIGQLTEDGYRFPMPNAASEIATDLAPGGVLRAALNLGNPVLAQGTPADPAGVTVDLAREVAARLGVEVEFACFTAAVDSFHAAVNGEAGLCFLAVEPARAAEIAFTAPYVLIEGVYAVPASSPLATVADVDRPGVRIGVKRGSAYDLFLSRTLGHATIVRGPEGTAEFVTGNLEAAAGIREPMTEFTAAHPGYRLIPGRFMEIPQAVGTARDKRPETVRFLRELVEELKASGFVADSLRRSGQTAPVAPPATPPASAAG